ncbi:TIR domain-containing protein [bacterium]|nr:TIR domain-containing protein [bacterium]
MPHDVFISYSHKDKQVANAVVAGLESEGIRCWIAPRDATPGMTWGEAIVNAIGSAKIMVMILSDNSNQSKQVLREVERATANEVIIIPFRIENIDPTGAMAYFLSAEHWLDALTPPLEDHIEKLIQTIKAFLSDEQPSEKPFQPRPQVGKQQLNQKKPLWPWLVVPSAIVLVVFLVIALLQIFGPSPDPLPEGETQTQTALVAAAFDVTPTAAPTFELIGEYRTSHAAEGLSIEDSTLYLANGADNLMRMNINNPANPLPLDVYSAYGAQDVAAKDGVAYIISDDSDHRFMYIDFKNQTSFSYGAETSDIPWDIAHIAVENDLVHLTGHNYWVMINVTDLKGPEVIWTWEPLSNSGVPCTIVVDDRYAYVGGGWTGLHIFDLANPAIPELIGGFDTPNWITGMSLHEEVLYLSLGDGGLLALDVQQPDRPIMLDTLELPGYLLESSAAGDYLYVIYGVFEESNTAESGVYAIDISDPEALSLTATYDALHEGSDIQATDDAIYVTDKPWGLAVLQFKP